jgi:DNA-binding MltR family transcriptional regulator
MWLTFSARAREALAELDNGSDRVIGIVAGAMIDASLTDVLRKELQPNSSNHVQDVQANLFQADGPLGSFAAKISLAYLLGYFTQEAYADLQNFKYIRNLFAHSSEYNSFTVQRIKDRCANFKLIETRVIPAAASVRHSDGTSNYLDSIIANPDSPGFKLGLVNHDEVKSTPRGRFVATAKLFCASLEAYLTDEPPNLAKRKPIL